MENAEAFTTLAELSFALAAATGIILALTHDPSQWRPFDAVRVFWLLTSSLGVGILALFPLGLHMAGMSPAATWRTSSGALLILHALFTANSLRQIASLSPEERANFRRAVAFPTLAGSFAVMLCQLLNVVGVVFKGSSSVYFFGLLWLLTWTALVFVLLIFLRPKSNGRDDR